MAEPRSAPTDRETAAPPDGYAPYGQLVKMLLPSVGSVAVYDASGELTWCSDGYEQPDLRALLDRLRAEGALSARGNVVNTSAGVPIFVSALAGDGDQDLGSFMVELGRGPGSRYTPSMVASMLRPVLDCLSSRMDLERTAMTLERPGNDGLDLLLSVDEDDEDDVSALQTLLRHCVQHLGCMVGALLVPDQNLEVTCSLDESLGGSQLLDRTHKHLLAWAQLNNRPMVVNRVSKSGDVAPYKILSCPVRDQHGRVAGLMALFRAAGSADFEIRDIRILEFVSRKAVDILNSQHDSLTGLMNPLIFERRVQALIDADAPQADALLYLDIDKLETINEKFGLHAGDEVIQRIADVVRRAAGAAAVASRIGGDRFAIYLPQCSVSAAQDIGRRMLATIAQLGYLSGVETVPVSASIGVVPVARRRGRVSHALAAGELTCKRAKQQGRNCVAVAESDESAATSRQRQQLAANNLQDALKTNDFRLDAQPIVALRGNAAGVVGYELLVRMRSAAGELLAPNKFLAAAERFELMPAIDRWVLCSALETLRGHTPLHGDEACYVSVNVSSQSVANRGYAGFALEQIAAAGLSPSAFCFEFKEAAAVNHIAAAEILIRELTAAGCKVALDDFGCGLSSLAHLKRLPVHYLKVDGRFVRRVVEDRIAESIVSGIARAARTLGVSTIAEHVETAAMADKLRELAVDFGQGYYFGRPQGLGEIVGRPETAPVRLSSGL